MKNWIRQIEKQYITSVTQHQSIPAVNVVQPLPANAQPISSIVHAAFDTPTLQSLNAPVTTIRFSNVYNVLEEMVRRNPAVVYL